MNNSIPLRNAALTIVGCAVVCLLTWFFGYLKGTGDDAHTSIKVAFVYEKDESTPSVSNLARSQRQVEQEFSGSISVKTVYNVAPDQAAPVLSALANEKFDLIFVCGSNLSASTKNAAGSHPDVQFCQYEGADANTEPVFSNYHTFRTKTFEGRYLSGVAAGWKLRQLISTSSIRPDQALIGYIATYPAPAVIADFTAFALGAQAVVPEVRMQVKYINTTSNYMLERSIARSMLESGSIILANSTDSFAAAEECELMHDRHLAFHFGFDRSLVDIAPTASVLSIRPQWAPYLRTAIRAVLQHRRIESAVDADIRGLLSSAGFARGWLELLEINSVAAAPKTAESISLTLKDFASGRTRVFTSYQGKDKHGKACSLDELNEHDPEAMAAFSCVPDPLVTILP